VRDFFVVELPLVDERRVELEQVGAGLAVGFPVDCPPVVELELELQLPPVLQAVRLAASTTATARPAGMRFMSDLSSKRHTVRRFLDRPRKV
jgi:hypothetical protein